MKYLCLVGLLFILSACGGTDCPAIVIPAYEVNVYDSVSGELLCTDQKELNSTGDCTVTYDYIGDTRDAADITVALDGYETQVLQSVSNEINQHACFDQWEYMSVVDVYLDRSE